MSYKIALVGIGYVGWKPKRTIRKYIENFLPKAMNTKYLKPCQVSM